MSLDSGGGEAVSSVASVDTGAVDAGGSDSRAYTHSDIARATIGSQGASWEDVAQETGQKASFFGGIGFSDDGKELLTEFGDNSQRTVTTELGQADTAQADTAGTQSGQARDESGRFTAATDTQSTAADTDTSITLTGDENVDALLANASPELRAFVAREQQKAAQAQALYAELNPYQETINDLRAQGYQSDVEVRAELDKTHKAQFIEGKKQEARERAEQDWADELDDARRNDYVQRAVNQAAQFAEQEWNIGVIQRESARNEQAYRRSEEVKALVDAQRKHPILAKTMSIGGQNVNGLSLAQSIYANQIAVYNQQAQQAAAQGKRYDGAVPDLSAITDIVGQMLTANADEAKKAAIAEFAKSQQKQKDLPPPIGGQQRSTSVPPAQAKPQPLRPGSIPSFFGKIKI